MTFVCTRAGKNVYGPYIQINTQSQVPLGGFVQRFMSAGCPICYDISHQSDKPNIFLWKWIRLNAELSFNNWCLRPKAFCENIGSPLYTWNEATVKAEGTLIPSPPKKAEVIQSTEKVMVSGFLIADEILWVDFFKMVILSFCQKRRWQVTAKHTCTLRMWLCMQWHVVWCTKNVPRWQQFHVAPAMPAL